MSVWGVLWCLALYTSAAAVTGSELDTLNNDDGQHSCSRWLNFNATNCSYECGSSLDAIVVDSSEPIIQLRGCHYMTASADWNKTVVGASLYACTLSFKPSKNCMNTVSCDDFPSADEPQFCSKLNRHSQLCSQCKPGYAPSVYSYSMACVKCNHSKYNRLKYVAVAFIPITVFYIVIVTFQVTVTSAPVNALILCSQIITSSFYARQFYTAAVEYSQLKSAYLTAISFQTVVSIWNLDFFRATYIPFCLTPDANNYTSFSRFGLHYRSISTGTNSPHLYFCSTSQSWYCYCYVCLEAS